MRTFVLLSIIALSLSATLVAVAGMINSQSIKALESRVTALENRP